LVVPDADGHYQGNESGAGSLSSDEGLDATHRAVLVLDRTGWHMSARLVIPDGLDVDFPPPASPERQPVERVWAIVDEPTADRPFADLAELTHSW